jgi:hypothetical protein
MNTVRQPAVAGLFYPSSAKELTIDINRYLNDAINNMPEHSRQLHPKAIIVPHAGYIYSGTVAAKAFATLLDLTDTITRVILMGPAHRIHFHGVAVTDVQYFRTPLGDTAIDTSSIRQLLSKPQVQVIDAAHWQEHSLEVQLPFLQTVLRDFSLVPIVIGDSTVSEVNQLLDILWGGPETLIVISSDLSHYHDYSTAQYIDRSTCEAIEHFDLDPITFQRACGCIGVKSLLTAAKKRLMSVHTLGLSNSGDSAVANDNTDDRQCVVGYGSWALTSAS